MASRVVLHTAFSMSFESINLMQPRFLCLHDFPCFEQGLFDMLERISTESEAAE